MDFPKDGLMSGAFPSASIPAVLPCSQRLTPGRAQGAQQWPGTVFFRMEVGQGQLLWCWCLDSSRLSPSLCPSLAVQVSVTWV